MSLRYFNESKGQWEKIASLLASSIKVLDVENNYNSNNVEDCLKEISDAVKCRYDDVACTSDGKLNFYSNGIIKKTVTIPVGTGSNISNAIIEAIKKQISDLDDRVSWLEENGGGGGSNGNTPPTITTTFTQTSFSTDDEIAIPYFLMDNQGGNFKANYSIDGEVKVENAVLGPNTWNVGKLPKGTHTLKIFIKDFSLFSNELVFNITVGSLEITSNFRDKDYGLNEKIVVNYDISSVNNDPIKVERIIDDKKEVVDARVGRNTWDLGIINKGVHNIQLKAYTDSSVSNILSYTFTVTDADSLFISTTFNEERWNVEDRLIIPYRISLMGGSKFKAKYTVNGTEHPISDASLGMNFWDLGYMDIGNYELTIEVTNVSGSIKSNKITLNVSVEATDFTPVRPVEDYLLCWFDAKGKSNSYADREEWKDKSGNNVKATLVDVNYSNNGWMNDGLRLTGDAYVEIDLAPFTNGAGQYGKTLDVQFTYNHSGNDDARIFSCEMPIVPYTGVSVNADNMGFLGSESINKSPNNEQSLIRATFVVDPEIERTYVYVNGVICNTALLSKTDSFTHDGKIYLNAQMGKDGNIINLSDCTIYNVRVYDKALTKEEVVQNHISDMKIEDQKDAVRKNTFSHLGQMDFDGDFTGMGADDQVPLRVAFSPNDGPGKKFDFPHVMVDWQGNSSLQYAIKNYNIDLYDEEGEPVDVDMKPDWPPHDSYHIKANMVDSSHAFNLGIAKLLPKVYTEPLPPMIENPDAGYRYAIDGFPITVFHNGKFHGLYTFNLKQHRKYFGLDKKNPLHFMYRAEENSAMGAAAFRNSTDWSIEQEFEERHPKRPAGTGVKHNELRRLIDFVKDSSDEEFVKNLTKYFNKNYLLDYYIICYVLGGIDSLGKNMTLTTWDSKVWYLMFYDMDTFFGFDNKGELVWGPDVRCPEDYNTSGSLLWERVTKLMQNDIRSRYAELRRGGLNLDTILQTLQGEVIDNIGANFYNMDATDKYLSQGAAYLYMAKGNRVQHLRRWLTARFLYVDSMFGFLPDVENTIILRNTMSGLWTLRIKTYTPQQITIEFGGTGVGGSDETKGTQTKLCNNKEWTEFSYRFDGVYQRDISITGAKYIMGLEGLDNCELLMLDVRYCEKLIEISAKDNPNLTSLNLSNCVRLQRLDVSGCTRLGSTTGTPLDVGNCYNLKYLDISNTSVPALTTTSCSYLTHVNISNSLISSINYAHLQSLKNVQINNCSRLTNVTIDSCQGITDLNIVDNPALREIHISNCKNLKALVISNAKDLGVIDIQDCPNITMIKIRNASSLTSIDLSGCAGLATFDAQGIPLQDINFGTLSKLKVLDLSKNTKLRQLDFTNCESIIEQFKITGDENLRTIKNINLLLSTYEQTQMFKENDYIQEITGRIKFGDDVTSVRDMFKRCIDLEVVPTIELNNVTVLAGMFQDCTSLRTVPDWNTSKVTDLSYMFYNCTSLERAPQFNTENVTNFDYMFFNCTSLETSPTYNLSSTTSLQGMFKQCTALTNVGELTTSHITNFSEMFMDCTSVEYIPNFDTNSATNLYYFLDGCISLRLIPNFNTSKVVNFSRAFSRCEFLTSVPEFNTSSGVNFSYMYYGNVNLESIPNIDLSKAETISGMFESCIKLTTVPRLNTSKVTNFNSLFRSCNALESVPELDTSKAVDIGSLFWDCRSLTNIPRLNTTNVIKMYEAFFGCVALTQIPELFTTEEDSSPTKNVDDMRGLFSNCTLITEVPELDTSNVLDFSEMFSECKGLTRVPRINVTKATLTNDMFNGCINLTETPELYTTDGTKPLSKVTIMYGMFKNCNKLKTIPDISTTKAENIVGLFENCYEITEVPEIDSAKAIYIGSIFRNCHKLTTINDLDLRSVNDSLYSMFEGCSALVTAPRLLNVSTKSNDFSFMFKNCIKLTTVPELDMRYVTNTTEMFRGCTALTTMPTFKGNLTKVTRTDGMFNSCSSLSTIPSDLDISNVTSASYMFNGCTALTVIPLLNTERITSMDAMFANCTGIKEIPELNTANVKSMSSLFSGCKLLQRVPVLNTTKVENMGNMFRDCISMTSIPAIDTSNATNTSEMFRGCTGITTVPSTISTESSLNVYCMFYGCTAIKELPTFNLNSIVQNPSNVSMMLSGCNELAKCSFSHNRVPFAVTGFEKLTSIKFFDSPRNAMLEVTGNPMLSAEALDEMFDELATVEKATINISSNLGTYSCDISKAQSKGWTVLLEYQ